MVAFRLLRMRDIKAERDNPPKVVVSRCALPGQRFTTLKHLGHCFADNLAEKRRDGVSDLLHHLRAISGKLEIVVE